MATAPDFPSMTAVRQGIVPNSDGVKLVMNPQGKIVTPIMKDPRFTVLAPRLGDILHRFQDQYKKHPQGNLFRYIGKVLDLNTILAGFNLAIYVGDASKGLNAFSISAVLTQIARANSNLIKMLDLEEDWSEDTKFLSAIIAPLFVDNTPKSLEEFSFNLDYIFSIINKCENAPRVLFIPCKFENELNEENPRTHWLLIVVEKQGQKTIVT